MLVTVIIGAHLQVGLQTGRLQQLWLNSSERCSFVCRGLKEYCFSSTLEGVEWVSSLARRQAMAHPQILRQECQTTSPYKLIDQQSEAALCLFFAVGAFAYSHLIR